MYIDGKGMFCSLCCLKNTMHPTNAPKIWNLDKEETKTIEKHAVTTELAKCGSYFIGKRKK